MTRSRTIRLIAIGAIAGFSSGLFGIGGGLVIVPLLTFIMRFDQHGAHATSLAAVILIGVAGGASFAFSGEVDLPLAAMLTAGCLVGVPIGARAMRRSSPASLTIAFGIFQVVVGIFLVFG